ncbi:MAG TPA: hypothetical protein DDX98_07055 [Bacteroidales bacterium]|jgi:hypothetical protein|nr:hypothetical protein [Bacteroidales bacterium]
MDYYFVNDNAMIDGSHMIHQEDCPELPYIKSKTLLGYHKDYLTALKQAEKTYFKIKTCKICCTVTVII